MKGGVKMSYTQLDHATYDLLKSLDDGLDLERNAAEYIIAWNSMEKSPREPILGSLLVLAEDVIAKKEKEELPEFEYDKGDDTGEGLLHNIEDTQDDLTNHIWLDGLQGGKNLSDHFSTWPVYRPNPANHPYREHHFPFHPANHPALRLHATTGKPHWVEMLRAHVFGGYMDEEAKMEKEYIKHLKDNKHPLAFGFKPQGSKSKSMNLLGTPEVFGTIGTHQKDFYERDYHRWKKSNEASNIKDSLVEEGRSSQDIQKILREAHFDQKANEWLTEDSVLDDDYNVHPTPLGHHGFKLGLEWFSPEERTAIRQQIDEHGLDNVSTIELPSGQKIPSSRFTYNALMRKTPEMNWAVRSPRMMGRNSHLRLEDNDTDYELGEGGRFLQSALGNAVHLPYEGKEESIADFILEEINNLYADDMKNAGKGYKRKLKYLPRLNLHKNDSPEDLTWEGLKDAEKSQFGKRTQKIDHSRIPIEDILFLAGFDPKTREPIQNHELHGSMEGPIVPLEWIENMEKQASGHMNLQQQEKDIRNHLSFLKAAHGPHPSEDKPSYWRTSEDGDYTYGPGNFWNKLYQGTGGAGMSLSTYNEILHALTANEDGNSLLGEVHESGTMGEKKTIVPNQNNLSLAAHFMPERSQEHGHFDANTKKYVHHNAPKLIQNILSPVNVSRPIPSGTSHSGFKEGATTKNNFSEHKSSLSPQYEYMIRHMTDKERQIFGSHLKPFDNTLTRNPFLHHATYRGYVPYSSDKQIYDNAADTHKRIMRFGYQNHLNTPSEKSVTSFNDLLRGEGEVSGGETPEDMFSFLNWGVSKPSYNKVKDYLNTSKRAFGLRLLTNITKVIGSQKPRDILEYLQAEDFTDLREKMGFDAVHDTTPIGDIVGGLLDDIHLDIKERPQTYKHKKPTMEDAVRTAISFGGALPAIDKEQKLQDESDDLLQQLNEADEIDKPLIREKLTDVTSKLTAMQQKAIEGVQGKGTTHWKIDSKREEELAKAHRILVAKVAPMIKEKMEEADPTAFDPNDPQKFIDNNARMFRDAQRYISNVSHSVHGLTTTGYGVDFTDVETKPAENKGFHQNVASHLQEHGFPITGNMSVDEVLEALAIEKTPQSKEHARELIERSNTLNQPLHASTVNQLISHGGITDVHGTDISHMHDESLGEKEGSELNPEQKFAVMVQTLGYHDAVQELHKEINSDKEYKKAQYIHALPRRFKQLMNSNTQFGSAIDANGLEYINNDVYDAQGKKKGSAGKGRPQITAETRNNLDSIIHYNPSVQQEERPEEPTTSIVTRAGMTQIPVGSSNPNNGSIVDTFDAGAHHSGWLASPSAGCEFTADGQIMAGQYVEQGLYHSVPHELTDMVHGKELREQVWNNAPPAQESRLPTSGIDPTTFIAMNEDPSKLALSEMSDYIEGLLNPDILLMKEDKPEWNPLIRPMHRIFELSDLEHLRGFSGSWVVSKWYDGKRVMIIKNGEEITALNESGKKVGLKKAHREALQKVNDNNFAIDTILGDVDLNVIDILNYDNNDITDMQVFERIKVIRSQFESHENVIVPGPHDTKVTDSEGLKESVERMQKEHENILLRDSKSTYMRGEFRHPKWVLYRPTRDYNFIVLDRRGNGPYTYQLGAGPLIDDGGLANRAIEHKGEYYMDVGTARNQDKAYKVGDVVRVSVSGVTKKTRGQRNVFTVQVKQIEGVGEGEGPASAESLDLLTKSYAAINIPHNVEYDEEGFRVVLKDIDTVTYQVDEVGNMWYLHSPQGNMDLLFKNQYAVTLAESLQPFWGSVAPLMLSGVLKTEEEFSSPPKKHTPKEIEEGSVGILEEDDENRLLKPEDKKKAIEVILRTLDTLTKEKLTWTGPRGLGIDVGTPTESPSGPTKITEEENLPDFDGRTDEERDKDDKKPKHIKPVDVSTEEGENLHLDYENDTPVLSKV
jgi:hypothetical protein